MPELPDITVYIEALHHRLAGRRLDRGVGGAERLEVKASGAWKLVLNHILTLTIRPIV
jgi:hypothetical protein